MPLKDVTELLLDWRNGDQAALDQLTPLVYQELRKLAASCLRRERPGHTLQPTALIHEAYLRLVDQDHPEWERRTHFFGIASRLMRQILMQHARRRDAAKRGGEQQKVPLDEVFVYSPERASHLVALDEALNRLAAFDERKGSRDRTSLLWRLERRRNRGGTGHLGRDRGSRTAVGGRLAPS